MPPLNQLIRLFCYFSFSCSFSCSFSRSFSRSFSFSLLVFDFEIQFPGELDDKMKWLKNFERLLEIQRSLVWPSVLDMEPKTVVPEFLKIPLAKQPCERLIVSPRRQIVLEGPLTLLDTGRPSDMHVILFDDMLLITRKKKGLGKKVLHFYLLSDLSFTPSPPPHHFLFDSPAWIQLSFSSSLITLVYPASLTSLMTLIVNNLAGNIPIFQFSCHALVLSVSHELLPSD